MHTTHNIIKSTKLRSMKTSRILILHLTLIYLPNKMIEKPAT